MPVLRLHHEGSEVSCGLTKVDRSKLYGYSRTEILDPEGRPCSMATLASDGKTLIPGGGVALGYLSPTGMWREKSEIHAVDMNGAPIEEVTSTFRETVSLETECPEETLLDHNIRMVYELSPEETEFPGSLLEKLSGGTIYTFPFSYRGGLTADSAFILEGADRNIWLLVGKRTDVHLIAYEQTSGTVTEEEGDEEEEEELDFNLF